MRALLAHHPAFLRLWAANGVSLVGDWLSFVAVSFLAIEQGGGAFGLAWVFAAHALPAALFSPLAGSIVDRYDRRRVLVAADVLASLTTLCMVVAAGSGSVLAVQALLVLRSTITAIVVPGDAAALRRLVPAEHLVTANGILSVTWSMAYIVGMALGGLAAELGPRVALLLDALSFLLAAGLHRSLPAMPVERVTTRALDVLRELPVDTARALASAGREPALLAAVLAKAPLGMAGGAAWVVLNLLGAEVRPFGAAALSFGVLQAIRGAGTGLGPLTAAWLMKRGTREAPLMVAASVLMLSAVLGLVWARGPLSLGVLALVWGIGTGTNWVLSSAAIQRHAEDAVIGRLAAFDELLVTLALVLSAFLGAYVIERQGLVAATLVATLLGAGASLLGAGVVRLRRSFRVAPEPSA